MEDMDILTQYIGKTLYIKTGDGYNYTLSVKAIKDNKLIGYDKFGHPMEIHYSECSRITVKAGDSL